MITDCLTSNEADYMHIIIDELRNVDWAMPILQRLSDNGGLKTENMPLLFELRYAHELHVRGIVADYEYDAGVGGPADERRSGQ